MATSVVLIPQKFSQAQSIKIPEVQERNIFLMPQISNQLKTVIAALAARRFSIAEKNLDQMIGAYPWYMESHYFKASLMAIQNKKDPAFKALEAAIENGFSNQAALYKDPNLNNIRSDPRFSVLAEALITRLNTQSRPSAPSFSPAKIVKNQAIVSVRNTIWDKRFTLLKSHFLFNDRKVAPATVQNNKTTAAAKLNELFRRGHAAGNAGDLYDNRDRRHSGLSAKEFPQLSFTQYSETAQKRNIDYGLNNNIIFNAPTFGNSSTALNSGPFWRSQARLAYTSTDGPTKLFLQYINNHLYVYPSVRDFTQERGDLFQANTPYLLISRGKSGSDRPHLKAIATILAAFKPTEKEQLIRSKQLIPAIQVIFRKGQKGIRSESDYLSGRAHPVVFDGARIDLDKMITLANEFRAENLPPSVFLKVTEESSGVAGIDDFTRELPEKLFDSPASIARIIRNTSYEKRLVVSTENTKKADGQPLKFKWILLKGDPKRVTITPRDAQGSSAEIRVAWHTTFQSPLHADIMTHRVEIGVFSDNGKGLSAPSFINFFYPPTQQRLYNEKGKLLAIDHRTKSGIYLDPRVFPRRDWRDDYSYDSDGQLIGWTRTRKAGATEFSRHGARILTKDSKGRPLTAARIGYLYERDQSGKMVSTEKVLKSVIEYQYLNETDRLGIIVQ